MVAVTVVQPAALQRSRVTLVCFIVTGTPLGYARVRVPVKAVPTSEDAPSERVGGWGEGRTPGLPAPYPLPATEATVIVSKSTTSTEKGPMGFISWNREKVRCVDYLRLFKVSYS